MTPARFELAIAELCQRDEFTLTRAMGGSGDLGADVIDVTPTGSHQSRRGSAWASASTWPGVEGPPSI
ncbi:restriction endonuclease [Streptomyces sp. NPDC051218]|uniref:restriction endonuclease n=1 Tax=Streptomyces sp. NPDC051218 TaxID=3365645 RepID=UPI003791E982